MLRWTGMGVAVLLFLAFDDRYAGPISAEMALPLIKATEPADMCTMPGEPYLAYGQASRISADDSTVPADWPGKGVPGGDVSPLRIVNDPYPTFDGIAVDPENDVVVMSDENRSSLLVYDRKSGSQAKGVTEPKRQIIGPRADLGFM